MATSGGSREKDVQMKGTRPASTEKKKGKGRMSLEEIKKRGRQLRSAHKDVSILGLYGGLTYDDFNNQPQGVGLVYDEAMAEHQCTWDPAFPEKPERLTLPYTRCQHYRLVSRCTHIPSRSARDDEVLLVHSQRWLDIMKSSAHMSEKQLKELSSKYDGVFFHKSTYECSLIALGSTIDLVDKVCDRDVRHGMALVRPPGHHAMYEEACGYCFFNNVAAAAEHALRYHMLQRVLIIDWDVHHGQGTQYAFYDDPRVMYFSIHRYEHGTFWPNLRQSDYDQIGEGEGRGYNVNVPLNKTQMTNGDYLAIFTQVLLPIAQEFNPQLVLVSGGFDAAIGCPEGENLVTPVMYAHFINMLKTLADGRLALILEGGYCLKSLSESVAMCLRVLLGDPCPPIGPLDAPSESMVSTILHVIHELRPYWRSLSYQGISEIEPELWAKYLPPKDVEFATEANRPETFEIYGDYILHPATKQRRLDQEIERLIANTNLKVAPNKVCLVYDDRMRNHKCVTMGGHPERPDRIRAIYEKHEECGLIERCKEIESRSATDAELRLVHDPEHIAAVKAFKETPLDELHHMECKLNSVYLTQEAYDAATLATGCVLQVVDEICTSKSQSGVAIVRPPGHHAEPHVSCGFCYFNTMAVAARYAQQKFNLQRVLILDWDIHHGNGTQHMFESDPSVLYISLHRYDNGFFFPAGEDGNFNKVGTGAGEGYNVNIPWNSRCGDVEYIAAFQQIIMPIAYEGLMYLEVISIEKFAPELVLVSAGFDAAKNDPLGGFKVTPQGYAHLTQMLMGLANGRVILGLEGGYNLHAIAESMVMCTSIMLGDKCPLLPATTMVPTEGGVRTIMNVIQTQKKYWKSLQFGVDLPLTAAQKETLMTAGDLVFKDMGMEHVIQGIDALSVLPLPDDSQAYPTEQYSSSSSSSSETSDTTHQSDTMNQSDATPVSSADQSDGQKNADSSSSLVTAGGSGGGQGSSAGGSGAGSSGVEQGAAGGLSGGHGLKSTSVCTPAVSATSSYLHKSTPRPVFYAAKLPYTPTKPSVSNHRQIGKTPAKWEPGISDDNNERLSNPVSLSVHHPKNAKSSCNATFSAKTHHTAKCQTSRDNVTKQHSQYPFITPDKADMHRPRSECRDPDLQSYQQKASHSSTNQTSSSEHRKKTISGVKPFVNNRPVSDQVQIKLPWRAKPGLPNWVKSCVPGVHRLKEYSFTGGGVTPLVRRHDITYKDGQYWETLEVERQETLDFILKPPQQPQMSNQTPLTDKESGCPRPLTDKEIVCPRPPMNGQLMCPRPLTGEQSVCLRPQTDEEWVCPRPLTIDNDTDDTDTNTVNNTNNEFLIPWRQNQRVPDWVENLVNPLNTLGFTSCGGKVSNSTCVLQRGVVELEHAEVLKYRRPCPDAAAAKLRSKLIKK